MAKWEHIDWISLGISVAAGAAAAVAGGLGLSATAVIAGVIAAIAPFGSHVAARRLADIEAATARRQLEAANEQTQAVRAELALTRDQLGPRDLRPNQVEVLRQHLSGGASFTVLLAHNRTEAEQVSFYDSLARALTDVGLQVQYFGGVTNITMGMEIGGPRCDAKDRLSRAFAAAGIPFTEIEYNDRASTLMGADVDVFLGVHPGLR